MGSIALEREECVLTFEGSAIQNHEMDISALANGLLAFQRTIEQANAVLNGKQTLIAVKVKGGFTEGSLKTNIIVEYIGAIVPVVPDIIRCVKDLVMFKKFLKGEPPQKIEPAGGGMLNVSNNHGSQITIGSVVLNLNNSAPVNTSLGNFFEPLGSGVDAIGISTRSGSEEAPSSVEVGADEKKILTPAIEDQVEEAVTRRELEILASQNDGKSTGWRFYDLEEDVEFTASISDETFLDDVKNKKYSFQNGDRVNVKLNESMRFVSQRKRKTRTVIQVLEYVRPGAI